MEVYNRNPSGESKISAAVDSRSSSLEEVFNIAGDEYQSLESKSIPNLENKEDYSSLRETDDSEISDRPKEDLKTFQERIDKLNWDGLMAEFKHFHNLESTYNSLIALIGRTKDNIYYSISQIDRFKTLDLDTQETCLKSEKLCQNILLKYLKEKPKYPLIKEGKILQSLSQDLYKNFHVRFSGVESDLLKLFTGYALKVIDKTIKYENVEKELLELRKAEKKLDLYEKGISGLEYITLGALGVAKICGLMDYPTAFSTGFGSLVSGKIAKDYCMSKKHKVSKDYDKKFKETTDLTKYIIAGYLAESRRATEAYLGV